MSLKAEMIMSSLTLRQGEAAAALDAPALAGGRFSTLFRRVIAARERQARHRALVYLGACTDERLADLGLTDTDIRAVRAGTFKGIGA